MAVRLQLPSDGTREVGLRHLAGPAAALDALMGIGPPLLELGTLDENAAPPSLDIHCTTDPLRRSAWVVRRTRAVRSRYRSFDDLTREQSWNPKRKKWPCSLTAPTSMPPPSRSG